MSNDQTKAESLELRAESQTEPRTAWLGIREGYAIICAWCPDKEIAEARARAGGLGLSHEICDECLAEEKGKVVRFPVCRAISAARDFRESCVGDGQESALRQAQGDATAASEDEVGA